VLRADTERSIGTPSEHCRALRASECRLNPMRAVCWKVHFSRSAWRPLCFSAAIRFSGPAFIENATAQAGGRFKERSLSRFSLLFLLCFLGRSVRQMLMFSYALLRACSLPISLGPAPRERTGAKRKQKQKLRAAAALYFLWCCANFVATLLCFPNVFFVVFLFPSLRAQAPRNMAE
jgi:hypothetical protein